MQYNHRHALHWITIYSSTPLIALHRKKHGSNRTLGIWSYEYKTALSQLNTSHQSYIMLKRIKENHGIRIA